MSTVSHELKTPITSIKAQTQLLERKFSKSEDVVTALMLKRINLQINRLGTIIKDLLDAGQVAEHRLVLRKEEYLFDSLVEETVADVQRTTSTHQIIVCQHNTICCTGDRDRICQVLTNLLTNAIKYSPLGNRVIVNFNAQQDQVYCSVQDFGMGIAPDKQAYVFDRFYRVADQNNNIISGFGLGLYICAQIMRSMGGKIGLSSTLGEGSVFFFSLPVII